MPQASTTPPHSGSVNQTGPIQAPTSFAATQSAEHSLARQRRWLDWQCRSIEGVIQATLFTIKPASNQVYAEQGQTNWPKAKARSSHFLTGANSAAASRNVVVNELQLKQGTSRALQSISIPLPLEKPSFVLTLMCEPLSKNRQVELSKLISWGSAWLFADASESDTNAIFEQQHGKLTQIIVPMCVASQSFEEATYIVVAQVAKAYQCERVSLGIKQNNRVVAKAISGMPRVDARMRLVRKIESAMEEAMEIRSTIDTAKCQNDTPHPQHATLASEQGGRVVSILLRTAESELGVLTMEFDAAQIRQKIDAQELETLFGQITTLLQLHLRSELSLLSMARQRLHEYISGLVTAPQNIGNYIKSLASAGLLLVLLASVIFKGEYRITTRAVIEGNDKQVVVAPYAGFIQASNLRSGDTVERDDIIATLDTSKLEVEKNKWLSELSKAEKNYALALAQGNRVELSLTSALREEISAELELVEQHISRSQIRAPFSGVIVSGDLNQMLGAPVERGDVLFELASLDQFRLMLDINERDIAHVHVGQTAHLRLSSMPGEIHQASLKSVQPVATVSEGSNVFRMQAELSESAHLLRPGMQGVARISAGERSFFWLWTHKLFNQIRVWFWTFNL